MLLPVLLFNMVMHAVCVLSCRQTGHIAGISQQGRKPDISKPGTEFHIDGLHNIIFLIMIVAAVILSGVLPGLSAFQDAAGAVKGIHLFGEVTLTFPALIEIVLILLAAFLVLQDNGQEYPQEKPFYLGCDPGGCGTVYRYLYHHAAGTDAPEGSRTESWYHQAV